MVERPRVGRCRPQWDGVAVDQRTSLTLLNFVCAAQRKMITSPARHCLDRTCAGGQTELSGAVSRAGFVGCLTLPAAIRVGNHSQRGAIAGAMRVELESA